MEIKNRKGCNMFADSDVESAKANGWVEVGAKPNPKAIPKIKSSKKKNEKSK